MYCHYFMKDTYSGIERLAQLRFENMMIKSIECGKVEYRLDEDNNEVAECDSKGSLGTWISSSDKLDLLSNKFILPKKNGKVRCKCNIDY